MDSLTQVILGAAVGEAVLGRRVGNRAMVWGGLAGTLPDLDVLSGVVSDPMSALAYHRAFTHSLPFAVLAAPILGLTVHRLYGGRRGPDLRRRVVFPLAFLGLFLLLLLGSWLMPIEVYHLPAIALIITAVFMALGGTVALLSYWRGTLSEGENASVEGWSLLFFLAIVTHPLLDCFTAYGTQYFQPFIAQRIAWNTISVVDPLYTLPFLFCLVAAARSTSGQGKGWRGARGRSRWNRAGLLFSGIYLTLTVVNHFNVGRVVERTALAEDITVVRSMHSPSLGNNVLWSATIEAPRDTYYIGQYSLLDRRRLLQPLRTVAGRHELLARHAGSRDLEILRWFTKGYFTVLPLGDGRVQLSDLRYGLLGDDPADPGSYIFGWTIDTTARPARVVDQARGPRSGSSDWLGRLWERMGGLE